MDTVQGRKLFSGTFSVYEPPELVLLLKSSFLLLFLILVIKLDHKTNSFFIVFRFFRATLFFESATEKSSVIRISNGRLQSFVLLSKSWH